MRNPIYFFGIFAAIGLPCLVLALYFGFTTIQESSTFEQRPGSITGFDDRGYPQISFSFNGEEITFRSNYQSSDMQQGDAVTVAFPPGEPKNAYIKSFFSDWFLPLFLGLFGVIFGGIGGGGIYFNLKKSNMKKELFDEGKGKKISADITGARLDTSYRVNGNSPFVIGAQWQEPATQMMYVFKSEYIWFDPSSFLHDKKKIDVYIDERDPGRYYVDISFLPTQAY